MAGEVDYMLRVAVADMAEYDRFYKRLIAIAPMKNVTSRFAMERMKHTTAYPLNSHAFRDRRAVEEQRVLAGEGVGEAAAVAVAHEVNGTLVPRIDLLHERLDEPEHRGDAALAADREDDAHRVARDVHDPQAENDERAPRRGEQRIDVHARNVASLSSR